MASMVAGAQGNLPTLLTTGAIANEEARGGKATQAPPQEIMVTEDEKRMCADVKSSQCYQCLNCGTTLAGRAAQLRLQHFHEIGAKVRKDDMGWPSVLPYMLRYDGHPFTGGTASTMPNIEMFQRDNIFWCGLVGGLCSSMWNARICCSAPCALLGANCAADEAHTKLLQTSLDDAFFNEIFNQRFGATMLRAPLPGEDTLKLEAGAVICDLASTMEGLEVRPDHLFQPCNVLFRQDQERGLLVEAVVVMHENSSQPTVYEKNSSSKDEWLWAKRLAVAGAVQRHQYTEHLVNGHMVMETFVALAYKHLSAEHYVFKLLAPVCGDVGFVNRTWGMDLMLVNEGAPYGPCLRLMSPQSLMSTNGVRDQVAQARQRFEPGRWFWFDEGGYMQGGCGVKQSTAFPLRDTARQLFEIMLSWASSVVEACWQEQDEALASWWRAIWWKQMKPAKRELSQAALSHVLATCILQATFVHDLAHDSWLPDNHSQLLWKLRSRGTSFDPKEYLPSVAEQTSYRLGLLALNTGALESPLFCYRNVFKDDCLQDARTAFEDSLVRIILATPYLTKMGSMSH
ncbi:unnamed protein product [Symbiodinium pilosum]|uniref:Lipoxygenase domain-containing protein n=1 Tax=Symbiodinium pilosum TaxID=2952 RepID=A0A812VE59_SYMPI|nr:unnamed protein product [Symbiodinium pilosum]